MIREIYVNDKVKSFVEKKAANQKQMEDHIAKISIEINYELSKLFALYQYQIQNTVHRILEKELRK